MAKVVHVPSAAVEDVNGVRIPLIVGMRIWFIGNSTRDDDRHVFCGDITSMDDSQIFVGKTRGIPYGKQVFFSKEELLEYIDANVVTII